jgi:hypothetical protein
MSDRTTRELATKAQSNEDRKRLAWVTCRNEGHKWSKMAAYIYTLRDIRNPKDKLSLKEQLLGKSLNFSCETVRERACEVCLSTQRATFHDHHSLTWGARSGDVSAYEPSEKAYGPWFDYVSTANRGI